MKIVHVISALVPGGAENLLRDMCLWQTRNGIQAHVMSLDVPEPLGGQFEAAGISVSSLNLRSSMFRPLPFLRLAVWLRRERADIIQTWMGTANFVGGLAARLVGCAPVVWGIHNLFDAYVLERWPRARQIARINARLSSVMPACIICCGQASMKSYVENGYSADKMIAIQNGVDVSQFCPDIRARRTTRAELGVNDQEFLIGMFARYHPVKDHATFIAAAAILHRAMPNVRFVLCGENMDAANAELSAQLEAAELKPVFHLLGERSDLPRLYAGLDVAALSSRFEAFPLVICEAMASGIPVVATDTGDCAHIIGDTGRVVATGDPVAMSDAWLDLLRMNPSDRGLLGARARQRICKEFTFEMTAQRYLDVYCQIAGMTAN